MPARHSVIATMLGGLLALALASCAAPAGSSPESVLTPAEPESAAPAIGVPVVDGDIEFVVNSVACTREPMVDDTYAPLAPDGQFCKVNVSATALSSIGMFLGNITITTAQGEDEVKPAVGAMMYSGTLRADYIDDGQTLTGDVVFDIAADDSVTTVLLKKNALSSGVVVPVD